MNTSFKRILFFIFFFTAFTSCISYKQVQLKEIKSVALLNNDIASGKIIAVVTIVNPNNYSIRIKKYDLNAYVNNNDMGKVEVEENIEIPGNSEQDYSLTFKPDISKIMGLLPSLFLTGVADASIKGTVRVNAFFISKDFNVDLNKRVSAQDFQ